MLNIITVLFKFKNSQHKINLARSLATDFTNNSSELSLRQKSWGHSKARYENYQHIFYSSHLELQEEHISYGLKRSLKNKIQRNSKTGYIEQLRLSKYVSEVPKNWMEDYEYYSGEIEDNQGLNENNNNLGTADLNIPPSNVACNGCGAPLHCNRVTSPGK